MRLIQGAAPSGSPRLRAPTIHQVLADTGASSLKRPTRSREPKRYSRPTAEDRVQFDSMKVVDGLFP